MKTLQELTDAELASYIAEMEAMNLSSGKKKFAINEQKRREAMQGDR